jgi:DNA mismatch repair protein MutL
METLDVPPSVSMLERVKAILGRRLAARVFEHHAEENGVQVDLYLLPPDEAQTTSRGVQLYCGRRFVRDRGLLHAVGMGYGELVPSGRYPTAIVFLDPPAGTVDVNVHPQKVEVRFARPQEVYSAVRHAVAAALARAPWLQERAGAAPSPVAMYAVASPAPPMRLSDVAEDYAGRQERMLSRWTPPPPVAPVPARAPLPSSAPAPAAPRESFFSSLVYLGQLDRTYLLCEGAGELVLIDQHAAHERIAFQRLREQHATGGPARTQRLLFPRKIELSAAQLAAADEHRRALESIGFELEPFGGDTVALKASPVDLRDEEVVPALTELLDDLAETDGSRAVGERLDTMFATIACHSVVRAGDTLSPAEALALLSAMDVVDFRAHCPHGRPVLLRIPVAEIARRFGRT